VAHRTPFRHAAGPGPGDARPDDRQADGLVDWTKPAPEIERAVRAFTPWPGAATLRAGAALRIWKAEVASGALAGVAPGTVLALDGRAVSVATGAGALRLLEVQAAGKKRMAAADWARGARLVAGERLGA
jgi:methionyl-tRNA formyltransferase